MTRPDWDEWGLAIAEAVATRADCSRRRVGAVVVAPDRSIIATGYNGAPPGITGCLAGGCPRAASDVAPDSSYDSGPGSCIAIHAEANALLRVRWDLLEGSTMYVTAAPCPGCTKLIDATPLGRVVVKETP